MTDKTSIDWKTYENITKYIYEMLGKSSGIKITGWGHNFKIKGKSGVKHQVDVLTSQPDGTTTAIECKHWNKKVDKDIIMKLSSIIQDTEIDKGIIVAKSGFTKDALAFARHCNISIVELREYDENRKEPVSKQFEFATLETRIDSTIHYPEILKIVSHPNDIELDLACIYTAQIVIAPWLRFPLNKYIKIFQNELHAQDKVFETVTKRYDGINAFVTHTNHAYPVKINGLSFTGVLKKIDSQHNREFTLVEDVSLIMKSIFEEKTFTISENGLIFEHKMCK